MRRVLITAGATRNPVDAMRYLSANSSGNTGLWLAEQLLAQGCEVWVLGSVEARLRGPDLPGESFGSTRDLMAKMQRRVQAHPGSVVVHAAAVGDYEVCDPPGKHPSGQNELVLRLTPTPKIIDHLKVWDPSLTLVSFKAAPPDTSGADLEQIADAQRARTGSALVFANVLRRLGTDVLLLDASARRWFDGRQAALDALQEAVLGYARA